MAFIGRRMEQNRLAMTSTLDRLRKRRWPWQETGRLNRASGMNTDMDCHKGSGTDFPGLKT